MNSVREFFYTNCVKLYTQSAINPINTANTHPVWKRVYSIVSLMVLIVSINLSIQLLIVNTEQIPYGLAMPTCFVCDIILYCVRSYVSIVFNPSILCGLYVVSYGDLVSGILSIS